VIEVQRRSKKPAPPPWVVNRLINGNLRREAFDL
jgi:hypothetical protein